MIDKLRRRFTIVLLTLFALAFGTHAVVMHALVSTGHSWDAGVVHTIAAYYAENGTTFIPESWEGAYLAYYSNNIPITFLLSVAYKAASMAGIHEFAVMGPIINSIAILGSFVILVLVAWKLYGRRAALAAYGIGFVLIILSAYTPITYTDTVGMFAVMLSLGAAVLFHYSKTLRRQLLWACLFGVAVVAAYLIKPTAVLLPAALVAMYLIARRFRINWRIAVFFAAGIIAAYGTYSVAWRALPNFAEYPPAYINERATSVEHFLGLGSLRGLPPFENCKRGVYCPDYVDWILGFEGNPGIKTLEERKAFALQLWKDSVTTDFPLGYTKFIAGKAVFSYSDGSFGTWGEGSANNQYIKFRYNTPVDRVVRDIMGPLGRHLQAYKDALTVVWFTILAVIGSGVALAFLSKKFRGDGWQNAFRLAVLGLTGYIMVFETRPRYLFLYVPIYILLAVGTAWYWSRWRQKHA